MKHHLCVCLCVRREREREPGLEVNVSDNDWQCLQHVEAETA